MYYAGTVSSHSWTGGLILGRKVRIATTERWDAQLTLLKTLAERRICYYKICSLRRGWIIGGNRRDQCRQSFLNALKASFNYFVHVSALSTKLFSQSLEQEGELDATLCSSSLKFEVIRSVWACW